MLPNTHVMLATVALAGALLAGFGTASGRLEYPRLGLIRVDSFDQALVEVRATMK